MKQTNLYSLLLMGVITLVGCMVSGCTEQVENETTKNRIMLTVEDDDFGEKKAATRGTKVTSISSFGVSSSVYSAASTYTSAGCGSYFFNESVANGSPTDFFWPTSAYKLSFFAYYPYGDANFTIQGNGSSLGAPTYAYTVPTAIANQVDVMTGQSVNILGGGSSPVNIAMKHRCAAICFAVTNERSEAITLTSVSIEGVKYSGTLNEESWTLSSAVNSSSSNPFALTYGSSIAADATANITGTTNIFLMLPQSIPAGAKLKFVISGEDAKYADLSGTWEAGKQYGYSARVTATGIIIDPLTDITDWSEEVKYIGINGVNSNNTWSQLSVTDGEDTGIEDWVEEDE